MPLFPMCIACSQFPEGVGIDQPMHVSELLLQRMLGLCGSVAQVAAGASLCCSSKNFQGKGIYQAQTGELIK